MVSDSGRRLQAPGWLAGLVKVRFSAPCWVGCHRRFVAFGSTFFAPVPVTEHIRSKVSQTPHKPGVYLHKDRFGRVIYVGKARDLRKRVSTYFQASRRLGWDLKFNALIEAIHDLDIHVVRSEPEALLLEGKLIRKCHAS